MLVESVINFCVEKLMPKLNGALTIDVSIGKFELNENSAGYVYSVDDLVKAREFHMELNNTSNIEDLLKTVCHEMVHVKQMARGQYRQIASGSFWYKKSLEEFDHLDYQDKPWEEEAFGLEEVLYEAWLLEHGAA